MGGARVGKGQKNPPPGRKPGGGLAVHGLPFGKPPKERNGHRSNQYSTNAHPCQPPPCPQNRRAVKGGAAVHLPLTARAQSWAAGRLTFFGLSTGEAQPPQGNARRGLGGPGEGREKRTALGACHRRAWGPP